MCHALWLWEQEGIGREVFDLGLSRKFGEPDTCMPVWCSFPFSFLPYSFQYVSCACRLLWRSLCYADSCLPAASKRTSCRGSRHALRPGGPLLIALSETPPSSATMQAWLASKCGGASVLSGCLTLACPIVSHRALKPRSSLFNKLKLSRQAR
jgi:hypothetical protein